MNSPKKIAIVVGTRPNFIKITQFEKEFNRYPGAFEYILIHTGQHFDSSMSDSFFNQLNIKQPDYHLGVLSENREEKIAKTIAKLEEVLEHEKPDLVIVPGDVDSTYAGAIAAKNLGLKLAHLESGLRSFDSSMPEEKNRVAVDEISDLYFVTEESGITNLKNEGTEQQHIHFVGNTMIDTLVVFDEQIRSNNTTEKLGLNKQGYVLMTIHRPKNVDNKVNLSQLVDTICALSQNYKVVLPVHPRTARTLNSFGLKEKLQNNSNIILLEPLDYFSFQNLILNANLVVTDSGGIQEETTFRNVPCLTIRPNTERPSTIELGTNELLPLNSGVILKRVNEVCKKEIKKGIIPMLWDGKSTYRIVEILKELL